MAPHLPRRPNLRLTLRTRILLPFFLILLTLGAIASLGSVALVKEALLRTSDERLTAAQQVLYREIKKQEILLENYAALLAQHQLAQGNTPEARHLSDQLYASLARNKISATSYPPRAVRNLAPAALKALIDQAHLSGRTRFRFLTDPAPTLSMAIPLLHSGDDRGTLLLQTPVDRVLLKQLSAPFQAEAFLLGLDGRVLAASSEDAAPPRLTSAELERVLADGRFLLDQDNRITHRHLITPLPLGDNELVLLSLEIPTGHIALFLGTFKTRIGLTLLAALLVGAVLYYQLIRQIMAPLRELLRATGAVGEGNLAYRIPALGNDELGALAASFNRMLAELESLYRDKLARERQLIQVQDEARFTELLAQKNQEIEKTNRELKGRIRELSALYQLNQAMSSTLDLNTLFDRTLALLKDLLLSREIVMLLYNPGSETLEVRRSIGFDPEHLKNIHFRLNEGITGLAARSKELQYLPDVAGDERYLHYKGKGPARGSMVSAPILVKNNLIGVLNLHKERPAAFSDTEVKLIQIACNQLGIAIENAQLFEKTRSLSNTDDLTRLANRRYFHEILKRELAHASRFSAPLSLILLDIDHFKQFNDSYGHLNGDLVLRKVGALLLQNTRGIDLVARFGGEEFVVLLPKTNRDGAWAAAEKLRQCICQEPFTLLGTDPEPRPLTISLGVAEFPGDSKDIYELLDMADRALYRAKQEGRNRTVLWSPAFATAPGLSAG